MRWVENEWDDDTERGWMLALAELEAEQCPLCGGPRTECQGPDAEGRWEAHAVRCDRTEAVSQAAANRKTSYPEALVYLTVEREVGRG